MYAANNAFNQYRQQGILTANPVELIVLLYDGCIKQLRAASVAIADKQYPRANAALQKAQDIIMELVNSLDLNYEIADDLLALYEFMLNELYEVNMDKDPAKIEGVVELLTSLREAWHQISKEGRGVVTLVDE